jgi:hypothetical protein
MKILYGKILSIEDHCHNLKRDGLYFQQFLQCFRVEHQFQKVVDQSTAFSIRIRDGDRTRQPLGETQAGTQKMAPIVTERADRFDPEILFRRDQIKTVRKDRVFFPGKMQTDLAPSRGDIPATF